MTAGILNCLLSILHKLFDLAEILRCNIVALQQLSKQPNEVRLMLVTEDRSSEILFTRHRRKEGSPIGLAAFYKAGLRNCTFRQ